MERTVTVVPEAGLHARPVSKQVQAVNRFDADVSIGRADGDNLARESYVPPHWVYRR